MEPVWGDAVQWPWGTEPGVLLDRRAPGMGRRILVPKGEKREWSLVLPSFAYGSQLATLQRTTCWRAMRIFFIGSCLVSPRAPSTFHRCAHFPSSPTSTSWVVVRGRLLLDYLF